MRRRPPVLALLFALAGCDHTRPLDPTGPLALGPPTDTLPRRLTYSAGDDRAPAISGAALVFSRLEAAALASRERCLALLPVEGGTLATEPCPPAQVARADSFVDTWIEPALSPDGRRIAYVWQEGSLVSVLSFRRARLVVAPIARPADTSGFALEISIPTSSGRIANVAFELSWTGPNTVRFLAAYEYIFKVKGGGVERYTDTTLIPLALMDADLSTGAMSLVPGGDSAIAYAPAPDGGLWLVKAADSTTLRHVAPGADTGTVVASFSGPVEDLADAGGIAVATVSDGSAVEWLNPVSSARGTLPSLGGPTHRVAAAGGASRRVVIEVERGVVLFGARANLWLVGLP